MRVSTVEIEAQWSNEPAMPKKANGTMNWAFTFSARSPRRGRESQTRSHQPHSRMASQRLTMRKTLPGWPAPRGWHVSSSISVRIR